MTITRIIDGKEYQVTVLDPEAAAGAETAEDWAQRAKHNSNERQNKIVRDQVLRFGRPTY